jgi:phage repressor protein C with HTH and peptisase S24 domain
MSLLFGEAIMPVLGRDDLDLLSVQDARAINVYGNGMLPLYRHGDQLIVSAAVPVRIGDRVIIEMKDKRQLCGTLFHRAEDLLGISLGGQKRKETLIKASDIEFLGRVIWASQ